MWPVLAAVGVGLLALARQRTQDKKISPKKVKSEAEIFAEGEAAGRAKRDAELATQRAEEARIRRLVTRQMKTRRESLSDEEEDEPAPPKSDPPTPNGAHA